MNIDPILAAEMVRVKELFEREPRAFNGSSSWVNEHGCGCIYAHVFAPYSGLKFSDFPQHGSALEEIFWESTRHSHNTPWAIARINRFLATGE